MRATIVSVESGASYVDKQQRVTLRFGEADFAYRDLKVPVSALGLNGLGSGPHLDQEIEVSLSVAKVRK